MNMKHDKKDIKVNSASKTAALQRKRYSDVPMSTGVQRPNVPGKLGSWKKRHGTFGEYCCLVRT